MQFIGIDLGTTNIRVSILDPEKSAIPQPVEIGGGGSFIMPAVVAFRQEADGSVTPIIGEEADGEKSGPDVAVVRNLKRYALSEDSYVEEALELRSPDWWQGENWSWNRQSRSVEVFGQSFAAKDLFSRRLAEAFRRADVKPGFEWTAGCPVHAGLVYRRELAQVVTELGGQGPAKASRIVEEPVLFLTLANRLQVLPPGSYMVYDLGGGSFDCALAKVAGDSQKVEVYGAEGNPDLGGSYIDELLADYLAYDEESDGSFNQLRLAKEAISPSNPELRLPGGKTLTWQMVEMAVGEGRFKPKSFESLRSGYRGAKEVWKREEANGHPDLQVSEWNKDTGEVRFIWELAWGDMIADLDAVILCGGPTKSPLFKNALEERFKGLKIISASELIPPDILDPELTAISAGACYLSAIDGTAPEEEHLTYINRLPVRIILEDLETKGKVEYPPYKHLSSITKPFANFVTGDLTEQEEDPHSIERYELTVLTPENLVLERFKIDRSINNRLIGSSLRLVVNHLGQVAVKQTAPKSPEKEYPVLETPHWQTSLQLQAYADIQDRKRIQAEEEAERIQRELDANRHDIEPGQTL